MKIRLKHTLAFFMSAVMVFSALALTSFAAAPDMFDDIQTITSNTFDVTILDPFYSKYYKFVPSQTGYYYISTNDVENAWFVFNDSEFDEIGCSYTGHEYDKSGSFLYFTAGTTYYIEIDIYNEVVPFTLDVSILYLGSLDKAEITSLPHKLTYIRGYETSDEYDYINYNGLELSLAFTDGSVFYLNGSDVHNQFDFSIPKNHLGTNVIALLIMGQNTVSFNIEVIENPVLSIEIVQAPYKEYYRYTKDGDFDLQGWFYGWFDPYLDVEGLKVKINYTNGTSNIVEFVKNDLCWLKIDDYYMSVYCDCCDVGNNEVSVEYLEHTTTFTIKVVDITLYEKLTMYFNDLINRIRSYVQNWMSQF